jgi:hypothetical protein
MANPVERISVDPTTDTQGTAASQRAALSHSGNFVAFESRAPELALGGTNTPNALLYDRAADTLVRLNNTAGSGTDPSVSGHGDLTAFGTIVTGGIRGISVYLSSGAIIQTLEGSGSGGHLDEPSFSATGGSLAFSSSSETFTLRTPGGSAALPYDATPGADGTSEIFVLNRNTTTPTLELVSRASASIGGAEANADSFGPSTSGTGNLVAFYSLATNLADTDGVGGVDGGNSDNDIFVYDRAADTIQWVNDLGITNAFSPAISANGQFVTFVGQAPADSGPVVAGTHIYVYDLSIDRLTLVDKNSAGQVDSAANVTAPSISADGRYVAFSSTASNLVDRDSDGVFTDDDTNGHADIFVYDRVTGRLQLVNLAPDGQQGNNPSQFAVISGDGQVVAFQSTASNLVPTDTNGVADVFVTFNNALPVVDLDGSVGGTGFSTAFDEGGAAVAIAAAGIEITDADDTNLTGATIVLTNRKADDSLTVNTGSLPGTITLGGIDISDPNRIMVTLTGAASHDHYELALQQVFFGNISENPEPTPRDITVVVSDGQGTSDAAHTTIAVSSADDPPAGMDDGATVSEDSDATAIDVLANDTDADGGTKVIASATDPAHGTVVLSGPAGAHTGLTYQPDLNFSGTDTFTYSLNGGSAATVTVTVSPSDDPPVAVDDTATVGEDSGATAIGVLANDTDIDAGPKVIASATDPAHGTVVLSGPAGAHTGLTYQPDLNFSGTDTFSYTLNGGSTATVSVTVNPQEGTNAAPEITSAGGEIRITENVKAVTQVTATDPNVGQALRFEIVGGADQASFDIDASGNLSFNSAPDFERPQDAGGNNVYDVVVGVSDDGTPSLNDTQPLAVRVTDVAESSALTVKFVSASASYKNAFGWYNTQTLDGGLLFDAQGGKGLRSGASTIIDVDTADIPNIAYFLIPNAKGLRDNMADELSGAIKVVQMADGRWAIATVDANGNVETNSGGVPNVLVGTGASALFSETSKNAGSVDYASSRSGKSQTASTLLGDTSDGPTGTLAWEDFAAQRRPNGTFGKPGDADYNDAVFSVSVTHGMTQDGTERGERLTGTVAGDVISGKGGSDTIRAGAGDDRVAGDAGNDFLTGGPGDDTFVFAPQSGLDTIVDFGDSPGDEDVIEVQGGLFSDIGALLNSLTQVGQDVVLELSPTDRVTLRRTSLVDLDANDFLIV